VPWCTTFRTHYDELAAQNVTAALKSLR